MDAPTPRLTRRTALAHLLKQIDVTSDTNYIAMMVIVESLIPESLLADSFGITRSTLVRHRQGTNLPQPYARTSVRDRIVEVLDTPVDQLLEQSKELFEVRYAAILAEAKPGERIGSKLLAALFDSEMV